MMADATKAGTSDVTYDLDGDGNPADEADLTLLKDVSVGVAELEYVVEWLFFFSSLFHFPAF
jgi:hypothetical protein